LGFARAPEERRSGSKPLWLARDGLELHGTVVPETRQIEGFAAEALSVSAGWHVGPHTNRACRVNQHLPGDPWRWVDG